MSEPNKQETTNPVSKILLTIKTLIEGLAEGTKPDVVAIRRNIVTQQNSFLTKVKASEKKGSHADEIIIKELETIRETTKTAKEMSEVVKYGNEFTKKAEALKD